ncbi:hypothetical protein ACFSTD_23985 [Novosphingobium colocasiae]
MDDPFAASLSGAEPRGRGVLSRQYLCGGGRNDPAADGGRRRRRRC